MWALLLAGTGCRTGNPGAGWQGTVDTTAYGTVVVANSESGVWDERSGWRLEEDLRIGGDADSGPAAFSSVRFLAVDAAGRIYVIEGQPHEIRVFDRAGEFLHLIGRKGAGPGEYEEAIGLAADSAGSLFIVDQRNARYSWFDSTGGFLRSLPRPISSFFTWSWGGVRLADGTIVEVTAVPGPDMRQIVLILDVTLHPADTVFLPSYEGPVFRFARDGMSMTYAVPYAPTLTWTLDSRGDLWYAITDRYRIVHVGRDGDTVRVIEKAFRPVAVTEAEKDSGMAYLRPFVAQGGTVDRSRIPDTRPPLSDVTLDDQGYLWVHVAVADGGPGTPFEIFDPEGRYLGRVTAAGDARDIVVRGAQVYAVQTDANGVPVVVRYRIVNR
jgi:hypothetical protein